MCFFNLFNKKILNIRFQKNDYFQKNCISNIKDANIKQVIVFIVSGSFIIKFERMANTIAPIENPINLPGQV